MVFIVGSESERTA